MAITVTHSKVSTIPDDADTSLIRPSDWNDDHVLVGLGTAAELDAGVANGVATLDSLGKVPTSELPAAILGALNYQGTWNASTNTPTLTSSVGTKGYYYVVSVAGSTNLNGITDWQIGDWAVFNGSVWQKIDNTDAVTSVNGQTGVVVLTAADVSAVPYTGATGAVDLNAKSLTNVSNLGIGTTSVPTIKIRAVGDNNSSSRIAMRGYSSDANSSAIRVTKFRGTVAAPQAPQSGDSLGKFELAGYGTTSSEGYPQASLEGLATEAWGATARGTKAIIKVTPNTTTTQVTALTIDQDSKATFANTVTANGVLLTGNTGTVTSVAATVPAFLSVTGSPITSSGTLALSYSGTALPVANGGTGLTAVTAGYIPFGSTASALATSANGFFWDETNVRLGIYNTAPADTLDVYGTVRLTRRGTTTQYTQLVQGALGLQVYTSAAAAQMVFSTNGGTTPMMKLDGYGILLVGPTTTNLNGGVLQLNGGITFPATQSASTDVNTLDDYEEGTWTVSDSSGAGLTFTNTSGIYTKVGRLVTCNVIFQYPVTVDGSQARISLPFTASNVTNAGGGVFNYNTPGITGAQPVVVGNQAYFLLANVAAGTAYLNSAASGTYFRGTISYFV